MSTGVQDRASTPGGGPEAGVPTAEGDGVGLAPRSGGRAGSRRAAARMAARDLRRHPWRTLLVLLLIGLPVFGVAFGSTLVASTSLPTDEERLHRQLWGFDGVIQASGDQAHYQAPDEMYAVDAETLTRQGLDLKPIDAAAERHPVCPDGQELERQDPGSPGSAEPACSVEEAAGHVLGGGGEQIPVRSVQVEAETSGASIPVWVHIADFTDSRLVGEGKRFDLVDGEVPAPGAALANPALREALAEAAQRAETRGAEPVATDRVDLAADGSTTELRLAGTMSDRMDDWSTITDLLFRQDHTEPGIFVQAGTPAAEVFKTQADTTVYLSGQVPQDYSAVRALNRAGFVGIYPPVATADTQIHEVFAGAWGSEVGWMTVLPPLLLGVLALAETGLLAGAAFAVGARQQRRATALLSVTGAEPATLRQTMVFSGLWCGLIAVVAGAATGVLAGCAVVWAARGPGVLVYGPHVPWWVVLGAMVLGVACAVVAAWIPARAVAGQDAWAAIKGASGERTPVRRGILVAGAVLAGLGLATVLGATLYGMSIPTMGELMSAVPDLVLLLIGGTFVLLIGVLLVVPGIVALAARAAGRLPVALRIAARDAHRNRSRTVPITAAVVAATAVGTVVMTSMALTMGDREQYSRGAPDERTAGVYVSDPEDIQRQLEYERQHYNPGMTAEMMGLYTGGPEGILAQVQAARALPGAPRLTQSWTLHGPAQDCPRSYSSDCFEFVPLYPEGSQCHLPIPDADEELARREQMQERLYQRSRQVSRACGGRGGSYDSGYFSTTPLDGILVVDTDRPETVPLPVLHDDPGLVRALEQGQAVVFDQEFMEVDGTVTLGEFTMDPSSVPGMTPIEYDEELMGPLAPGQEGLSGSALEGRNPIWAPERTVTLDAVRADPLPGDTPLLVIPVSALDGLEQRMELQTLLMEFSEPITEAQANLLNDELAQDHLVVSTLSTGQSQVLVLWGLTGLMGLIVITVAGITTGLALADARRDHTVLSSIGANPGTRKSMAAAQTFTASLLGTVLGVPVGALAVIGIGLVQDGEAAWVPWPQLALLVVGVPLLAAAITWLVVPGRLPVRQADRD